MRLAGLISGGKDSVYASRLAQEEGHKLSYIVSLQSQNPDSYMFHTVNIEITKLQAEAWQIPYVIGKTLGIKELELDDLKNTLSKLDIDGVITGAIASRYQADRIDRVCNDLGIYHYHPIWGVDRKKLLEELIQRDMNIIFSSVAAHGLDSSWLGEKLNQARFKRLVDLNKKYGLDICGEGGEYETLVIDTSWFRKRIKILEAEKTWEGISGKYIIRKATLETKETT